ncbi:MAG: TIGR03621 family F420-dependent LLM class oxidoreductase [Chloroflexota bacterium]
MRRPAAGQNSRPWPDDGRLAPSVRCSGRRGAEAVSEAARRFRFGLVVSQGESRAQWREVARQAEDLGYATLLVADHFGQQLAPMPAMLAAAEATTRLRVGTFVLDNDFRHPAAVAKEAATVDLLTDGRLELGIGAGWNAADYRKTGLSFDAAGVRVSRLAETVQIISAFFLGGTVSFHGKHYQIDGLDASPLPVQRPRPPIMLGANGTRMLRLAARQADILNFPDRPPVGRSTAGNPGLGVTFDQQMAVVRQAAAARYAQLELSVLCIPRITDRVGDTIDRLAAQMETTAEVVRAMPATLVGSTDSIVDKLVENRERFDLSYPVVFAPAMRDFAPVVARLASA